MGAIIDMDSIFGTNGDYSFPLTGILLFSLVATTSVSLLKGPRLAYNNLENSI